MRFLQLVSLATAAIASPLLPRAPVLPSQDPFYSTPSNIGDYKPGQVIKTRDVPPTLGGFTGYTKEPIKRYLQVLYCTTDSQNQSSAAVASILIPSNANSSQLLAYQTAYDTANNNCSPSYSLQTGANATQIADIAFISAALNRGYYIVTSDYEGLSAGFTNGIVAGRSTLDSVRAARSLASTIGLSSSALYAMWGYSGGALASEWAAELQPSYAPELHFEGTALGGLTPNITSVLLTINKGPFAGLAFSGISGINKTLPAGNALYTQSVIPAKKAEFESIAAGCLTQAIASGGGKDLFTYFKDGNAVVRDPRFTASVNQVGVMGTHGVPTMPLYVYKATGDEISPSADTDALVKKLCAGGATVQYKRDLFGEHFTEAIVGSVGAFSFIADRLDGKPVAKKACSTQDVLISTIEPGYPESFTIEIVSLLQSLLGSPLPLGPINGSPTGM